MADNLVRQAIGKNPTAGVDELEPIIKTSLDFLEFDAFWVIAQEMIRSDLDDVASLLGLFKEWEVVEAKEMMRVTEGRIATIGKLQDLIEKNALEVPTLHNFLKEFPWVIDPRWTLIADEVRFSDMLKKEFPDDDIAEEDRRIDFLCVRENTNIVVVEIKRPGSKASNNALDQIFRYVSFVRDYVQRTTDPELATRNVAGYLLCGDLVDTWEVREKRKVFENSQVYVRRYGDLLDMVKRIHQEFIKRYEQLQKRIRT